MTNTEAQLQGVAAAMFCLTMSCHTTCCCAMSFLTTCCHAMSCFCNDLLLQGLGYNELLCTRGCLMKQV